MLKHRNLSTGSGFQMFQGDSDQTDLALIKSGSPSLSVRPRPVCTLRLSLGQTVTRIHGCNQLEKNYKPGRATCQWKSQHFCFDRQVKFDVALQLKFKFLSVVLNLIRESRRRGYPAGRPRPHPDRRPLDGRDSAPRRAAWPGGH